MQSLNLRENDCTAELCSRPYHDELCELVIILQLGIAVQQQSCVVLRSCSSAMKFLQVFSQVVDALGIQELGIHTVHNMFTSILTCSAPDLANGI